VQAFIIVALQAAHPAGDHAEAVSSCRLQSSSRLLHDSTLGMTSPVQGP